MNHNYARGTPSPGRFRRSGKGRGNDGREQRSGPSVPSSHEVVTGAGVSIILKIDQPTGRQVQGIVQEVLGRGNHPRGIKVRLEDGRVGRTQAIVPVDIARTASTGLSNLGRNGETVGHINTAADLQRSSRAHQPQFTDMRYNDSYDYESRQASGDSPSLMDYVRVKPKKSKINASRLLSHDQSGGLATESLDLDVPEGLLVTCPVCGKFEGDESAVAFHANSHFD